MSDSNIESKLSNLADMQTKLIAMEEELKVKCGEYDKQVKVLKEREKDITKREASFNKKFQSLSSSESFAEMVSLIDKVYTLYVSMHSSDTGLYESIKLILDARKRYQLKE